MLDFKDDPLPDSAVAADSLFRFANRESLRERRLHRRLGGAVGGQIAWQRSRNEREGRENDKRGGARLRSHFLLLLSSSSHEGRSAESRKNRAVGGRGERRALLFVPLSGPSSDFTENHGGHRSVQCFEFMNLLMRRDRRLTMYMQTTSVVWS